MILVLAADPALRASIAFALEAEGATVVSFALAEDFVGAAAETTPDCVLIDESGGIDAIVLIGLLRASGVEVPTVVLAGRLRRQARTALQASHAVLIEKPMLGDMILSAVAAAKGRWNAGPGRAADT